MDPKISIVVPVYNVEQYLRRSIDSILNQTLKNIEIILVNDGSTDNSLSICEEYQSRDKRIRVIDKENGGVSSARNAGIEVAKGKYIGFVDPDDWIDSNMFENLYFKAETTSSDICMCNFVIEANNQSIPNLMNIEQEILEGEDINKHLISNMLSGSDLNSGSQTIMGSVWRLIVRRDLIERNNLKFELGVPLMEDLIFCVNIFLKSNRVSIDKNLYYHYEKNDNSAVSIYRDNMLDLHLKVYKILKMIIKKEKLYTFFEKRLRIRYVNIFLEAISNEVNRNNRKKFKEKIIFIKKITQDKVLKKILKSLDFKGYTLRKRIVLKALYLEWSIILYFYYKFLLYFAQKKSK